MDRFDLTREQAAALKARITPHGQYLAKVLARLDELRVSDTDPLHRAVTEAVNANRALWMHLHYMSDKLGLSSPFD